MRPVLIGTEIAVLRDIALAFPDNAAPIGELIAKLEAAMLD